MNHVAASFPARAKAFSPVTYFQSTWARSQWPVGHESAELDLGQTAAINQ